MGFIDIKLPDGSTKKLPLDMLLGDGDSFALAKHLSGKLDVSVPKKRTGALLHILQLVAALFLRIENLERENERLEREKINIPSWFRKRRG